METFKQRHLKGGKGKSKGKGNLGTIIMCFRCARIGHSRVDCKMAPVRCSQCGGDHSDSLHTKSDLTVGQRRALMNDAQSRGRAAGRPVAAAAIPFEDYGGDSVPELSRAVHDQLGFDDADVNDDSGAMVRFAVAIPFDADNQRYAMMPVYGRIERIADVALCLDSDEATTASSGEPVGGIPLGSDSNFTISNELHRQDVMLACRRVASQACRRMRPTAAGWPSWRPLPCHRNQTSSHRRSCNRPRSCWSSRLEPFGC